MYLKVTVGEVDRWGFNGRDHHPAESDSGREGVVLKVEVERMPGSRDFDDDPTAEFTVLTVELEPRVLAPGVTEPAKIVELIAHEIAATRMDCESPAPESISPERERLTLVVG